MLVDVVEVRPLGGHWVHLRFADGLEGELDLGRVIRFSGPFAALRSEQEFLRVRANERTGALEWPNGATLEPEALYAAITGVPVDWVE